MFKIEKYDYPKEWRIGKHVIFSNKSRMSIEEILNGPLLYDEYDDYVLAKDVPKES